MISVQDPTKAEELSHPNRGVHGRIFKPIILDDVTSCVKASDGCSNPSVLSDIRSYSGAMLALTGIALLTFNWLGFFIILGCSLTAYYLRLSGEEKVLLRNFGEDYRRYAERTKRLIPGIY